MAAPAKLISTSQPFQDSAGNVVVSGFLRLQLSQNAEVISGGGQVTNQPLWLALTAGGKITTQAIWFSDELNPAVNYSAQLFGSNGILLIQDFGYWTISGASADLSTMVPTVVGSAGAAGVVLTAPGSTQTIVQPSGTSLNVNRFEGIRFADQFSGADIGAKINAAAADLGANGGTIIIPAGTYSFSTQINLSSTRSIILQGQGGNSSGAATATNLTWTGTGTTSPLNLQNTNGCCVRELELVYSSGSFTGVIVDASGPSSNTAYLLIDRCVFGGVSVISASSAISLDKAQSSVVRNCLIGGAANGIIGAASGASFSNANQVIGCTFSNSTGNISSAAIKSPAQGWVVEGCTFEMGNAAGNLSVIAVGSGVSCSGLAFIGNWIGDFTAGSTSTVLSVAGSGGGFGWSVTGNYVGGVSTATFFDQGTVSFNGSFHGNVINTFATGFKWNAANSGVDIAGNSFSGLTAFQTGTPGGWRVIDDSSISKYYGANHVFINNTALTAKNSADAEQDIVIQPGSTTDQNGGIIFNDRSGNGKWKIFKSANNRFDITDLATSLNVLEWTSGGNLSLNSANVMGFNNGPNSGAGGFIFGSGGASPSNVFTITSAGITTEITANGANWVHGNISENLTLSTAGTTTDTAANLLPANSIIEAVVARVTTTITTATDWKLGDATQAARFSAANATMTAGATSVGLNQADPTVATANLGPVQSAAAKVRVTTTGTPGAGVIRITVFYRQFVAPTS